MFQQIEESFEITAMGLAAPYRNYWATSQKRKYKHGHLPELQSRPWWIHFVVDVDLSVQRLWQTSLPRLWNGN